MNKIDTAVVAAFKSGDNFNSNNTEVLSMSGVSLLLLHGYRVAVWNKHGLTINLCVKNTVLLRRRVNALLSGLGHEAVLKVSGESFYLEYPNRRLVLPVSSDYLLPTHQFTFLI